MASRVLRVWNGTGWEVVNSTNVLPVYYQASAPSNPSTGTIWVDSDATAGLNSNDYVLKSEAEAYTPHVFLVMGS